MLTDMRVAKFCAFLFALAASLFGRDYTKAELEKFENSEFLKRARAYENGCGVERNMERAFDYYELAAHEDTRNPIAFDYLKKCAEEGNPYAEYFFGIYYFNPERGEMDNDLAFFWFKKSADKNFAKAIWATAHCYDRGIGVEKDLMKAFILLNLAEVLMKVEKNSSLDSIYDEELPVRSRFYSNWESMLIFGGSRESREEFNSRYGEILKRANSGDIDAQAKLGCEYFEGYFLYRNFRKALSWWLKAANNEKAASAKIPPAKYASSQYAVGLCNLLGLGTDKDEKSAFNYFSKAAENGLPTIELARCHLEGWGTPKDETKALEVFKKVLNGDEALAKRILESFKSGALKDAPVKRYEKLYKTYSGGDHELKPPD